METDIGDTVEWAVDAILVEMEHESAEKRAKKAANPGEV